MKKVKKWISLWLCIIFVFSTDIKVVNADECVENQGGATTFEYSLTPDMEEWGELNHGERVLALQIPQDILKTLETRELLDVVLNYPCFIDMIFYDTYQDGFQTVKTHFNGLQELFSRKDVASVLLLKYESIDINQMLCIGDIYTQFNELLKVVYIETMLAQNEILSALNTEELSKLSTLTEKNYILQRKNESQLCSPTVSAYYSVLAENQGDTINAIKEIKTPNGSTVTVILRTGVDNAYNRREAIKNSIEANYPGVTVVGDATIKYNCHAYAWAGNTSYWMNDPSIYWEDGSYILQTRDAPSAIGQKAYYGGVGKEHSGIVVRLSGNKIRSKWGEQSLVEHSVSNCPYFFIPLSVAFYGR